MTNYNGWTNYATWRVNLEIVDGIDPSDMGWQRLDKYDLADAIKEYVEEILESQVTIGGRGVATPMVLDYALAFLSDVNWREIAQSMIETYSNEEAA